jgi:hypothetical protein
MILWVGVCNAQISKYIEFTPKIGYWNCNCDSGEIYKMKFLNVTKNAFDIEFQECENSGWHSNRLEGGGSYDGGYCPPNFKGKELFLKTMIYSSADSSNLVYRVKLATEKLFDCESQFAEIYNFNPFNKKPIGINYSYYRMFNKTLDVPLSGGTMLRVTLSDAGYMQGRRFAMDLYGKDTRLELDTADVKNVRLTVAGGQVKNFTYRVDRISDAFGKVEIATEITGLDTFLRLNSMPLIGKYNFKYYATIKGTEICFYDTVYDIDLRPKYLDSLKGHLVFYPLPGKWSWDFPSALQPRMRVVNVTNVGFDVEVTKCPLPTETGVHFGSFYINSCSDSVARYIYKNSIWSKDVDTVVHVSYADIKFDLRCKRARFMMGPFGTELFYYYDKGMIERLNSTNQNTIREDLYYQVIPYELGSERTNYPIYSIVVYDEDEVVDALKFSKSAFLKVYANGNFIIADSILQCGIDGMKTYCFIDPLVKKNIVSALLAKGYAENSEVALKYYMVSDAQSDKLYPLFEETRVLSNLANVMGSNWPAQAFATDPLAKEIPKAVSSEKLTEAEAEKMFITGNNSLTNTQVEQAKANYEGNAKIKSSEVNAVKGRQKRLNDLIKRIEDKQMVFFDTAHNEVQMQVLKQISKFMNGILKRYDNLDKVELEMVIDLSGVLNEFIEKGLQDDTTIRDSATIEMYSKIIRSLQVRMQQFQINCEMPEGYNYGADKSYYHMLAQSLVMPIPPAGGTHAQCFASIDAKVQKADGTLAVANGYTIYYRDEALDDIGKGQIYTLGVPTSPAVGQIPPGFYKFWLGDSVTEEVLSKKKKLEVIRSNTKDNPAVSFIAFKQTN